MAPVVKPEIRLRFPAPRLQGRQIEVSGHGLRFGCVIFEFRVFDFSLFDFRACGPTLAWSQAST